MVLQNIKQQKSAYAKTPRRRRVTPYFLSSSSRVPLIILWIYMNCVCVFNNSFLTSTNKTRDTVKAVDAQNLTQPYTVISPSSYFTFSIDEVDVRFTTVIVILMKLYSHWCVGVQGNVSLSCWSPVITMLLALLPIHLLADFKYSTMNWNATYGKWSDHGIHQFTFLQGLMIWSCTWFTV